MADGLKRALPKLAGLVLLAGVSVGANTGAQAQPFFGFFGRTFSVPVVMAPEAVYHQLVRAGYQPMGRLQRNGRVFIADVIDPYRRQLRLVIDSADGVILERYVVATRIGALATPPAPGLARPPADRPVARVRVDPRADSRTEPRTASRQPPQDRASDPRRATAPIPQSSSEPKSVRTPAPAREPEPALAEAPPAPAPAPVAPAPRREPAPTPRAAEGPGYANGVPINPLD